MRRLLVAVLPLLLLTACSDPDGDYANRMADEHAEETPAATAATSGADSLDVTGEDVVYATIDGQPVTGYLAQPQDGSAEGRPAVIVIQEWWGLNDNIRAMARKIAAEGYTALAVDLYSGKVATVPDSAMAYMRAAMDNEAQLMDNVTQAYSYLTGLGASSVGSVGWCFGGGWSLRTALALPDDLDAAVIYYGQVITDRDQLAALNVPVLGLFGAEDQGIPVADVQAFESTLRDLGKEASVHIYEGADHAFANPSGGRYNAEAAEDAWARTLAFFADHLRE